MFVDLMFTYHESSTIYVDFWVESYKLYVVIVHKCNIEPLMTLILTCYDATYMLITSLSPYLLSLMPYMCRFELDLSAIFALNLSLYA